MPCCAHGLFEAWKGPPFHTLPRSLPTTRQPHSPLPRSYILYTSDNGFQLGNHAQKQGKQFHWEEITRVPFYMRGARACLMPPPCTALNKPEQ